MRGKHFVLYLFLLVSLLTVVSADDEVDITGKVITGQATSQLTNLSMIVDTNPPLIFIYHPVNKTYLPYPFNYYNINNIDLNYSAYDVVSLIDTEWYNLNNTQNITLSGNTTLNISDGFYKLRVFANDTAGFSNYSVVDFYVNSSLGWFVCPVKYNGTTTNFTALTMQGKSAMQNMSNVTLEIVQFGKIRFIFPISLNRDICWFSSMHPLLNDYSDVFTSLTPLMGYAYVDPNYLPEFNISAEIWFYNLNYFGENAFQDPVIKKNGKVCSAPDCIIESYTNGTLKFNVSHAGAFYSVDEAAAVGPPGPSVIVKEGGGGGVAEALVRKIVLDPTEIKVSLKQGETKRETITITNIWDTKLKVVLVSPTLERFLKFSERVFELKPGESKKIDIDFIALEIEIPDLYLGRIYAKVDGTEEDIFVAVEIESKKALLDVKAEIPKKYQTILPGEDLLFTVYLYSLGREGKIDTSIDYIVKDLEGNTIVSEHETIAVETQASFIKSLKIPEDAELGRYLLYVKATYDQEIASSSVFFNLGKEIDVFKAAAVLIALALLIIYLLWRREKIVISTGKDEKGKKVTLIRVGKARNAMEVANKLCCFGSVDVNETVIEIKGDHTEEVQAQLIKEGVPARVIINKSENK